MDLIIRIPQKVRTPKGVYDIIYEHNDTFQHRGAVAFGKFGAPLSVNVVNCLGNSLGVRGSKLYAITKRSGKFDAVVASIQSVTRASSKSALLDIVPSYYSELENDPASYVILASSFEPAAIAGLELASNGRPLKDVLQECRTSVMLVEAAQT